MGHIGKLVRGNPQLLRQNLPVSLGLVQHVDKIRVLKNILDLTGGQQILYILCQAARYAAPFTESFPDFHAETSGLAFQKEMEFVDIEPGRLMFGAVGGDTVPHGILHNEKPDLFQGLAQRFELEAEYPMVVHVNVGTVIEHIQGAIDVDFQRRSDILCLRLRLFQKQPIQVAQDRHILRARVLQVIPVHKPRAAVNDGPLNRGKPFLAADNQVTQRQDKITFQCDGVFIIRIVQVNVHRIDIVGGSRGNVNDLPLGSKLLYQRPVLIFRVRNNDVILR